jgi:uncharacterized membrane protein SirB2
MDYALIRTIHIACAVLSVAGFVLRGGLMLAGSPLLQARLTRIAPHVVDTVLLGSAVALAWMSGQYPFAQGWLTAKLLALVAYVVLGTFALKRARTRRARAIYFILALATVLYIVSVAVTRSPLGVIAAI